MGFFPIYVMLNFSEWMNQQEQPDSREINSIYKKANIAVQIVQMYQPDLLKNISTIANLASGSYGLYNSGENQKQLPTDIEQKLIFTGKVDKKSLNTIPTSVLKKYYPEIDEQKIKESDTIRVNVRKILSQVKSPLEATIQIASTIVHEATHANEMQTKGFTNESGPLLAEKNFQRWVAGNMTQISKRFPEINLPENQIIKPPVVNQPNKMQGSNEINGPRT